MVVRAIERHVTFVHVKPIAHQVRLGFVLGGYLSGVGDCSGQVDVISELRVEGSDVSLGNEADRVVHHLPLDIRGDGDVQFVLLAVVDVGTQFDVFHGGLRRRAWICVFPSDLRLT